MPRKTKRRPRRVSDIPGLLPRGTRAYWACTFPEAVGGDRVSKRLEAEWGSQVARDRAVALNQLRDRGDWAAIRRWASGSLHITTVQTAVRDGDWKRLKQLSAEGPLLGAEIKAHLQTKEATKAAHTHAMHRAVCERLLARFGAEYPMARMTVAEAQAFLHEARPQRRKGVKAPPAEEWRPWSPATQKFYRMVAGNLWRQAIAREREAARTLSAHPVLTENPWRDAEVMETWDAPPAVLTEAEIRALLAHPEVAGTPTETLLAVAAWGGLRCQEITHLRLVEDVDLDAGVLWVQSRMGEQAWRTKTRRSQRKVTIPPRLVALIRRHIEAGYAGSRYLFVAPARAVAAPDVERALHEATARRWTELAFTAGGIDYGRGGEGLTLHSLRHSHATMLLSKGISIAYVAARLGDTVKVVGETYAHWIPDDEQRAVELLERAAGGAL